MVWLQEEAGPFTAEEAEENKNPKLSKACGSLQRRWVGGAVVLACGAAKLGEAVAVAGLGQSPGKE